MFRCSSGGERSVGGRPGGAATSAGRTADRGPAVPRTGAAGGVVGGVYAGAVSIEPSLDLPPAQQARSRLTQQRILEAGTALLEEGGTEALTVAAVAARAGVSVGSVYRRFGGKDRPIAALQHDLIDQFGADNGCRLTPPPTGPAPPVAPAGRRPHPAHSNPPTPH